MGMVPNTSKAYDSSLGSGLPITKPSDKASRIIIKDHGPGAGLSDSAPSPFNSRENLEKKQILYKLYSNLKYSTMVLRNISPSYSTK